MVQEPDERPGDPPARAGLGFATPATCYFVFLWLLFLLGGRSRFFRDPGSLWHPVVGQQILSSGHFTRTDPFSFTCAGQPWIARQWLADCALAVLHDRAGLDGMLLGTATVLAAFYAWLGQRLVRVGFHWLPALLVVMLTVLASAYHFHARPHLVTIVLLGWTYARLCDVEAGSKPLRTLLWLVPVFVLWVNAHDGVVGGMATVGLAVAGWVGWAAAGSGPLAGSARAELAAVGLAVACALTTLVNPYGLELPRTWLALLRSPVLPQVMVEHAPLLSRPVGWTVMALAGLYLVVLASVRPLRPRVTWLLPLAWLILALGRIRHGPLFAATAVIALGKIFPHTLWAGRLAQRKSGLFRRIGAIGPAVPRWRALAIPAFLVLGATGLQLAAVPLPLVGRGWARLDRAEWPVDLLPQLHRYEAEHAPGMPIFNEMLLGGFLIDQTPDLRVFVDDRCELYGDEALRRYVYAEAMEPALIEQWASQYSLDAALVLTGSGFDRYLRRADGWRLAGETAAASLYRKRPPGPPPGSGGARP